MIEADLLRITKEDKYSCPWCTPLRRSQGKKDLKVTPKPDGVAYYCHHCNVNGFARREPHKREEVKFMGVTKKVHNGNEASVYLNNRGISDRVIEHFNVSAVKNYFPSLKKEGIGIAFPYFKDKKVYGNKFRSVEDKSFACDVPLHTLFGAQMIDLEEEDHIVICEGEIDVLSMEEAGVMNAVSVPNGAGSFTHKADDEDMEKRNGFLWHHRDVINKAKKIYIAVDDDEPGQKLAEELARRIGKHRVWLVKYEEGCKDANDMLQRFGGDVLRAAVLAAEPYPVAGLYEAAHFGEQVDELYEKGFGVRVPTGFSGVDELYSVSPGLLTVVTGIPGHGKTTLIDQIMVNMARRDPSHIHAICSFENQPHIHIAKLAEMYCEKTFLQESYGQRMTPEELTNAKMWINQHFKFFYQDSGSKATLSSVIERLRVAIFRWGIKSAVIDPYNYVEKSRKDDSETQWIDDMLTELRLFAQANGLHIWFIAHPTKLPMNADGSYSPPRGYSISGSSAWYSKPDFGITVYKDANAGCTRIINWKTRFNWLGKEGETNLYYDLACRVFRSDALDGLLPHGDWDYEAQRRGDRYWDF